MRNDFPPQIFSCLANFSTPTDHSAARRQRAKQNLSRAIPSPNTLIINKHVQSWWMI